jgi:hypothetical protein
LAEAEKKRSLFGMFNCIRNKKFTSKKQQQGERLATSYGRTSPAKDLMASTSPFLAEHSTHETAIVRCSILNFSPSMPK